MAVQTLPRVFKVEVGNDSYEIPDTNPDLTLDEMKSMLAGVYPQIASGEFSAPEIMDDKLVYTISGKKAGVKG